MTYGYSTKQPTITVNGVDITTYVDPDSVSIENVLTRQVDTFSFRITEGASVDLREWHEVVVTDPLGARIFGGYIQTERIGNAAGGTRKEYNEVRATDYACLFDRVIVREQFTTSTTDAAILAALFAEYLPGEGFDYTSSVHEIATYPKARFNRSSLREVLDTLASGANADWYVDANKVLHYFPASESELAPFALSDSPDGLTSWGYDNLQVDRDGTGVINRIEIIGGAYLSADDSFILAGNGQDTRIALPFKMSAPTTSSAVVIERNDGTSGTPSWTAMTVKTGYIDSLATSTDVLHYYNEQVLEQQNAWPNLPNAVRVTARHPIPLRTRVQNQSSYAYYGRWFDSFFSDQDLTDKTSSQIIGRGMLAQSAYAKESISLTCRQPGLRAGQTVSLTCVNMGIGGQYVIQKVSARLIGGLGAWDYAVTLGALDADLVDVLIELSRRSKPKPIWRDDEVLDEAISIDETLVLDETTSSVTTSTAAAIYDTSKADLSKYG